MRVLYVCGTYAPRAFAGSELSAHQLLQQLALQPGFEVLVVTDQKYTGGRPVRGEFAGIILQGIEHERRHEQIEGVIKSFCPDVILTQLLWSDAAVTLGESLGIATVLRLPSKAQNQDIERPTALVANSHFMCNWVNNTSGRHCRYLYSTIELNRVIAPPKDRDPRYVTMFNPIRQKGGHVFKALAQLMPDREFAAVPGWHSLRNRDGSWNSKVIRDSLESQNAGNIGWEPEDVSFEDTPNVWVAEPTEHVARIFALTRVLLVPSQYEETLARVSVEAFANGIPVIGSEVGGLQEHIRIAGYLISDFANPHAWAAALNALDDPTVYARYADKALTFIRDHFSNEKVTHECIRLFREAVEAHAHGEKL